MQSFFFQEQEIDEELELLVLASDGLWDVVPNDVSPWISLSLSLKREREHACSYTLWWLMIWEEGLPLLVMT